ncbi:MAG: response regulator, partial [Elusimicrobia bacterium]|nr:response regulator [Elusimicrobiota bacterium]
MKNTILLVEDNPDDEELIIRSLKEGNILNRVTVARDGEEALDCLFARGPHAGRGDFDLPSVVLLDLQLPKLNGIEVLARIRADKRT